LSRLSMLKEKKPTLYRSRSEPGGVSAPDERPQWPFLVLGSAGAPFTSDDFTNG
jgi:hypothetical protein